MKHFMSNLKRQPVYNAYSIYILDNIAGFSKIILTQLIKPLHHYKHTLLQVL